jgi:diadenosine tetraphosphatase ApaH/serine/threonine PP2A family protein phosphatase
VRYGIISDIHSNWEALSAVLGVLEKERVDRYICPGDLVGYGADPNRCVEAVRGLSCVTVLGNHDSVAAGREEPAYFNPNARRAIEWTREVLDGENKGYLEGLSIKRNEGGWLLVHATPCEPEAWHYILSEERGAMEFPHFNEAVCLFGHTHYPHSQRMGSLGSVMRDSQKVVLEPGFRYLLNVGSIGQPRDRDPRAAFGIFDNETGAVEFRRVEYDIVTAQKKILDSGLPRFLAERLSKGV